MGMQGIHSPTTQANVMLCITIGVVAGAYLYGFLSTHQSFKRLQGASWLLLGIGNVGFALGGGLPVLTICAALVGLSSGISQPLNQSAVLARVSDAAASRAIGLAVGSLFLGQFLHPYVVKVLAASLNLQQTVVAIGLFCVVVGVLAVLWPGQKSPHTTL
jgi:MFS family permease